MTMFDNYNNLNSSYHPNNMAEYLPDTYIEYTDKLPRKEFNLCGEFIGYSWNYGDTLTLEIPINPTIKVEADAIIFTEKGDKPTEETVGKLNQRAYNIYDLKCWKCATLDRTIYNWVEEDTFNYPVNGIKEVQLKEHTIEGKAIIRIFNFRWEEIKSFEVDMADTVSVEISKEISQELLKGIYNCSVDINNERVYYQAPLIVK